MKTIMAMLAGAAILAAPLSASAQSRGGGFRGGGAGAPAASGGYRGGGGGVQGSVGVQGGGGFRGGGAYRSGDYRGGGYRGGDVRGYGYGGYRGYGYGYPGYWGAAGLGFALGASFAYPWYYGYPGYYASPGYYFSYYGPADGPGGYEAPYDDPLAYDYGPSPNTSYGVGSGGFACGQWVWNTGQSKYDWTPGACPPPAAPTR